MRYLPKLQQLKVFQQVIRTGSIRAAARAMNQTQPAVSRALRELEQTLETQLIIRGTHGMTLTPSGQAFAQRMQFILEELQRAVEEVQQIDAMSAGSVTVGFSSLMGMLLLPQLTEEFSEQFPQTTLRIEEGHLLTLLPALREGRLDLAIDIVSPDVPLAGLGCESLFITPICVLARRHHPLQHATSIAQLDQASWVLPDDDMGYYHKLSQSLLHITPQSEQPVLHSNSLLFGLTLVLSSDYLTLGAAAILRLPFIRHMFRQLPIPHLPSVEYSLLYSQKTPLTLTARRFIELVRQRCQQLSGQSNERL